MQLELKTTQDDLESALDFPAFVLYVDIYTLTWDVLLDFHTVQSSPHCSFTNINQYTTESPPDSTLGCERHCFFVHFFLPYFIFRLLNYSLTESLTNLITYLLPILTLAAELNTVTLSCDNMILSELRKALHLSASATTCAYQLKCIVSL